MGAGVLIIVAAGVAALYLWYASIIARRNKVQEALSSVDVHLNQRHDLIPNIVSLAGRFMQHERALLTEVTRLREEARKAAPATPTDVSKRFALEGELGQRVGQLLVSMEAYPELKSDRPVMEAQQTWTEIEAQITASRRFYNAAVNQLNNAIQIFPGSIIAGIAKRDTRNMLSTLTCMIRRQSATAVSTTRAKQFSAPTQFWRAYSSSPSRRKASVFPESRLIVRK
jgi:LemA protein